MPGWPVAMDLGTVLRTGAGTLTVNQSRVLVKYRVRVEEPKSQPGAPHVGTMARLRQKPALLLLILRVRQNTLIAQGRQLCELIGSRLGTVLRSDAGGDHG